MSRYTVPHRILRDNTKSTPRQQSFPHLSCWRIWAKLRQPQASRMPSPPLLRQVKCSHRIWVGTPLPRNLPMRSLQLCKITKSKQPEPCTFGFRLFLFCLCIICFLKLLPSNRNLNFRALAAFCVFSLFHILHAVLQRLCIARNARCCRSRRAVTRKAKPEPILTRCAALLLRDGICVTIFSTGGGKDAAIQSSFI